MVTEITAQNINQVSAESKGGLLVVDFWAPWCGPCKMFMPMFHAAAAQWEPHGVKFGKINIDEQPALAKTFGIRSVPTVAFVKNGNIVKLHTGALSPDILSGLIRGHV